MREKGTNLVLDRRDRLRRPAALTQGQIETLLDGIERLLTSQTTPIDKVYWLKGAYSLPSSFPARFERLLNAVSESKAVVRAPNGNVGKWLGVITARMPGFSIAYLKEPVYSMQIGDVIEEIDSKTESRRFIDDPNMVAVRLRASAAMRLAAQPAPAPSSDTPSLTGRLVHSAKDLFDQRGYLLAPDAANTLRAGLRAVQQLWTATEGAASVKESALKETAGRLKKSAASPSPQLSCNSRTKGMSSIYWIPPVIRISLRTPTAPSWPLIVP